MLRIEALEIDDSILDKIEAKHNVLFSEVEEAVRFERRVVRKGRYGLYLVFSQTSAGRYLFVVLAHLAGASWKVVTAREMDPKERRLYARAFGER
ncbi:MAG: BrnT family toxin [Chloroflexota bacterium]|nr:BrnT family toxin [Chloroflexota bacterium]